MFRKGGGANMNGIMSGIEDRENFENGTPSRVEELAAANLKTLGGDQQDKGFDPLTTFLLQYGPAIASQPAQGKGLSGLISTGLAAAEKPVANLLENQAAKRKYMRDLKAGATELAIKQAGDESLLEKRLAGQKELAEMELGGEGMFSTMDVMKTYGYDSRVQADNRKKFENNNLETKARDAFGSQLSDEIFIGGKHGKLDDYERKENVGKVYYDVTDGNFKRLRRNTDKSYSYEIIDITSFDPKTDKKDNTVQLSDFAIETNKAIEERRKIKEAEEKIKRNQLLRSQPNIDPYSGA